jgi:hypothetical protein
MLMNEKKKKKNLKKKVGTFLFSTGRVWAEVGEDCPCFVLKGELEWSKRMT